MNIPRHQSLPQFRSSRSKMCRKRIFGSTCALLVAIGGLIFTISASHISAQENSENPNPINAENSEKSVDSANESAANDSGEKFIEIGNDIYAAERTINIEKPGIDNVFAAGKIVTIANQIGGSAYLAGQNVSIQQKVRDNVYAVGQNIFLQGKASDDVFLAGETIVVSSSVANDMRVAGDFIQLNGNVGGDVLAAARSLEINGRISGSALLLVNTLSFAKDARILGSLTIFTNDKTNIIIPETVISTDRIVFRSFAEFGETQKNQENRNPLIKRITQLIFLSLGLFGMARFSRRRITNVLNRGKGRNTKTLWLGFLFSSALVGSIIVSAVTIIGIPIALIVLLATIIASVVGYYVGTYLLVCRIWQKIKHTMPETNSHILMASVTSAILAALIANAPWFSWWFMLAISFFGIGSIIPVHIAKNTSK